MLVWKKKAAGLLLAVGGIFVACWGFLSADSGDVPPRESDALEIADEEREQRAFAALGTPSVRTGALDAEVAAAAIVDADAASAEAARGERANAELSGADAFDASIARSEAPGGQASAKVEPAAPKVAKLWRVKELASDPNLEVVDVVLGDRTLVQALQALGIPKKEQFALIAAFRPIQKFNKCHPANRLVVARTRAGHHLEAFELVASAYDTWQARNEGGKWRAIKVPFRVDRRQVAKAVSLSDDLRASIVAAGLDDDLVKIIDDAIDGRVSLKALRAGAKIRVAVVEDRIEGEFVRYSELEALEFFPKGDGAPVSVYYYPPKNAPRTRLSAASGYYDVKGRQPYHGGWRLPIPLMRISSRFNMKRVHPVLHRVVPHNGIDFAASPGTPIYATAAGSVIEAGNGGACGNMVRIQHYGGLVSAYCHMSRFAPRMRAGARLKIRQLIGYVGQTGRVTGPHLHFAVKRNGKFIDPLGLKLDGIRVLPKGERQKFAARREELDRLLASTELPATFMADIADPNGESDIVLDEP